MSIGKVEGRTIRHNRESSCNFPVPVRIVRNEMKYTEGMSKCNAQRDYNRFRSNRFLMNSNVDSGLGESTPQEFSSRCSSSADSAKHLRARQLQVGGEECYELSPNKEYYIPVDATLDAVLQPIISTLTRRQRGCPK